MTEARKARIDALMKSPGKRPVDSSQFADSDGEIECTARYCAYNKNGYCRYHAVEGDYPAYTEEDGCLSGVPEDPVIAMPAVLSPSSAKFFRLLDDQGELDVIKVANCDDAFEPMLRKAYLDCRIADGEPHDQVYPILRANGYALEVVDIIEIRM